MNISSIPATSVSGKLLRFPLRAIPPSARLPILQGPSRGKRWIVGSSNHGCWLGSYEKEQRLKFEQHVSEGDVVFDIGAHAGFYTLVASALVGPRGHVVAFEPLPENLEYLRRHLSINCIENVSVIDKAVSDRAGVVGFEKHENRAMGRISDAGELRIEAVSLDERIGDSSLPPPNCIKMDVEGAEYRALSGAREYLSSARPTVLLSTHGAEVHGNCCRLLRECGFDLVPLDGTTIDGSSTILALDGA